MKAVIFARVSSKDQEDGHSLDAQIQSCYEYAIKNNFKVVEQFKVVESSTVMGRPEFSKMVSFVKNRKEKVNILCHCVDRLQRDFDEQYLELQKLIKLDKVEIHYVQNGFIEHKEMDSSAKFRKNLDVLLANDYRNKISDNVKRSNKKKLEEGTILGDLPIGYLNTKRIDKKKEKVNVYIDPMRGDLIRKIFEYYATGAYSMNEVRSIVTEEGLITKKGVKISKSQVEKILQNPFYYGYMKYNGLLYKHIHPRLISKELFDECKNVRIGKRKVKSKRTEKLFILKGMLTCQHCGCAYSPEIKKEKYVYMRPTKSKGKCDFCYHISEEKILVQIEKVIQGIRIPEKILLEINEELKISSDKEYEYQKKEAKRLQEQYDIIQTRLKRARSLLLDMDISKDEYDEMVMEMQAERDNVEVKLNQLSCCDEEFNKKIGTVFVLCAKAHELFKSSELDEKRRIIKILFPNLKMDAGNIEFTVRKPFDMFMNFEERPTWLPE